MIVHDGEGGGSSAGVDSSNRLKTNASVKHNYAEISRINGNTFLFAVGGFQTLNTINTDHAMLYLKNNSETDFHIENIRSCNSEKSRWMVYKNITGGTIISGAANAIEGSLNLKSNKSASVDLFSGGEGITFSGGAMIDHWVNGVGHSVEDFGGSLVLGNGDSIMIMADPLVTASVSCCRIIGYFE